MKVLKLFIKGVHNVKQMKTYIIECDNKSYDLYVGESAVENWSMLSKSKQWYYFFHLSSFPSGYGMLDCENGEDIPKNVLQKCAEHVRQNTKYRNMKNLKVDCTKYSNVKRGEKLGEVVYKRVRDIFIL